LGAMWSARSPHGLGEAFRSPRWGAHMPALALESGARAVRPGAHVSVHAPAVENYPAPWPGSRRPPSIAQQPATLPPLSRRLAPRNAEQPATRRHRSRAQLRQSPAAVDLGGRRRIEPCRHRGRRPLHGAPSPPPSQRVGRSQRLWRSWLDAPLDLGSLAERHHQVSALANDILAVLAPRACAAKLCGHWPCLSSASRQHIVATRLILAQRRHHGFPVAARLRRRRPSHAPNNRDGKAAQRQPLTRSTCSAR